MNFLTDTLPATGMRLSRLVRFILGTSGLMVLVQLAACGSEDESANGRQPGAQAAVKVVPHTVTFTNETIEIQAVGTARAVKTAVIRSEGAGEVSEVPISAGQLVNQGDLLLRLESDEEELAVEAARVALKDAQQLVSRFEGIELPGAISDSRIDEVKIAAERAKIELQLAILELERRQVRAPFSGTVGLTDIDPGARIDTDTEIVRLDDRSSLFIDFQAPEEVYGRFEIGSYIDTQPFANAGKTFRAEVHKIDSRIDEASRSFTVRAIVDNKQDELRPGMSFKINIEVPGRPFPQVPEAAIIWGGDGPYVWLVDNQQTTRQSVTIVSRNEGLVLVNAPISDGATVVAEGVQKVREGTAVEFVNPYGTRNKIAAGATGEPETTLNQVPEVPLAGETNTSGTEPMVSQQGSDTQ